MIYKELLELAYYTEDRVMKYPKDAKGCIGNMIKEKTYNCVENVICAYRYFDKKDKLEHLYKLDINLKMIGFLIRISKRNKYISPSNYAAWSKKLSKVSNLLGGWIKRCQKQ